MTDSNSDSDALARIEKKIDIFLQESLLQQSQMGAKLDAAKDAIENSNEYIATQTQIAEMYFNRLLAIYKKHNLRISDLILALSGYFHNAGLTDIEFETEKLLGLLPREEPGL